MAAEKSFALKLNNNCACLGCKDKVKEAVKMADGEHSWNFDAVEGKLTVVSDTVDPQALLAALRKDFKNAELLSEKQFYTKSSLQIVAAKPLQGVLHHNSPDDQLHQLSHNTHQGNAYDDDDNNNNDDVSLGMSTTEENKFRCQSSSSCDYELHKEVECFSMVAEKSFALKLSNCCACDGCMKIINEVLKTEGVHSKNIDANEGMVTISGTVEPHALIAAFAKHDKKAELLLEQLNHSKIDDQLQIVPTKPVQGVHDNLRTPPQLQQLSENNQRKAFDDDDEDNKDDDGCLAMSTTKENKIGQSSHKHDLELKNYNKPFICSGCKELGFGPRFKCDDSSCEYELHKECKECCKSTLEIPLKFLEGYTFEFCDQLSKKVCDACGKDICGFGYHSKGKGKSLDLHPCCSKLETKICVDGYDFELHDNVSSKCMWCNKKDLNGSKTGINSGWSYVSACKRCHFHVYCVTDMVREAWKQGLINNTDSSSMALQKMDTQLLLNSNRNDGRRDGDHQVSRHTTKMILKAIVGVLLGDPTMLLASVLVELFT